MVDKQATTKPSKAMNLYQKLVEVRKGVEYLQKDTKGYNFKYVSGSTVLGTLRKKMDELGLILVPSITEYAIELFGNKPAIKCKMLFTWVNSDAPEDRLEIPFCAFGSQNDISQAFGSALTYSERYFMLKFFNIPTDDDDPDAHTGNGKPAATKQAPPKQAPPKTDVPETEEMGARAAEIADAFEQASNLMELEEMRTAYRPEVLKMSSRLISWLKLAYASMESKLNKEGE
jgi:hypothetical protein